MLTVFTGNPAPSFSDPQCSFTNGASQMFYIGTLPNSKLANGPRLISQSTTPSLPDTANAPFPMSNCLSRAMSAFGPKRK
jgi:hypothetical protein